MSSCPCPSLACLQCLIKCAGPTCMSWQRVTALQVLRTICLDHMLVYRWAGQAGQLAKAAQGLEFVGGWGVVGGSYVGAG